MAHCGKCKMNFSKPSNLRAHVKRKHPDKLDIIAPITRNQAGSGSHTCRECNKCFVSFGNLRFHVKQKHSDKLEELAPVEMKNYKCNQCDCQFDVLKQLVKHRSSHNVFKTIKCSLCQYTGASTDILIQHYTRDHCLEIINETLEFESIAAFQAWKSTIEAETFASFVQTSGAKKTLKHTKTKYFCHRSGTIRTRGNNTRKLKSQGSNKIGGYCPAKMTIFTENEKCMVKFCKSHVGHAQDRDLEHLSLTKTQRENIAAKIAAKIPLQAILDEIRDSVANCSLERIHLLTKKDLYNIEKSFNLKGSSVRHAKEKTMSTARPLVDNREQQLDERRKKLLQFVQGELLHANSLDEIEAAERILAPLKPTLTAVRSQQQLATNLIMSSSSNTSHNKIQPSICNQAMQKKADPKKVFS